MVALERPARWPLGLSFKFQDLSTRRFADSLWGQGTQQRQSGPTDHSGAKFPIWREVEDGALKLNKRLVGTTRRGGGHGDSAHGCKRVDVSCPTGVSDVQPGHSDDPAESARCAPVYAWVRAPSTQEKRRHPLALTESLGIHYGIEFCGIILCKGGHRFGERLAELLVWTSDSARRYDPLSRHSEVEPCELGNNSWTNSRGARAAHSLIT